LKTVQAPPDDVDPLDDDENTDDDDPPSEAEVKAKVDEYLSAVRSANVEMSRPAAAGPPSKPEMKRAMSAGELTIRPTESDFVCPDECAECCLTKHFGFASHKRFKCVLRKPLTESATPPKGRNCDAVVHGSQKAPHQGKTHCNFNGNETALKFGSKFLTSRKPTRPDAYFPNVHLPAGVAATLLVSTFASATKSVPSAVRR